MSGPGTSEIRAELFRGVVEEGRIHSQPFSEGVSPGATSGVTTRAVPVEGGFLVTGRKIFASLSGAADFYNVTAQVEGEQEIRFLGVPATAEGVRIEGTWDPLGMRGTVSRTLVMDARLRARGQRVAAAGALRPGRGALPLPLHVAGADLPRRHPWPVRLHPLLPAGRACPA